MSQKFQFFVGTGWATENHAVCVLDRQGYPVAEYEARRAEQDCSSCWIGYANKLRCLQIRWRLLSTRRQGP
jgi:hypothetical protein